MASPSESPPASQPTELFFTFDILDYIFAFLRSDSESLIACSKVHPSFSTIVERHLYYNIVIPTSSNFKSTGHRYCLEPLHLKKLLFERPQIVNYVCVLQIAFWHDDPMSESEFEVSSEIGSDLRSEIFGYIALILPMFPVLEYLELTTEFYLSWEEALPQTLKTAVEDCLRLPTLHELHVEGLTFPLSMLNGKANIKTFSLSHSPEIPDCPDDPDSPQLKSLIITEIGLEGRAFFSTWAKRHITKLQSLKCDYSHGKMIPELLEICSDTLNDLDLKLHSSCATTYRINTGEVAWRHSIPAKSLLDLSSLPNLQHFTIRVDMEYVDYSEYTEYPTEFYISSLPTAVEILKTASSLQRLTIEIGVGDDDRIWGEIDFSPLTVLAESSAFRHIDLYIADITHTRMVSKLARYEGLKKLIEQGVLIIHAGEAAP